MTTGVKDSVTNEKEPV